MPYSDDIPQRLRVLVLGGGIHGVGVLHDLASRGWRDIHLVEKGSLGAGTSSRSTKLIHGGLRYLKRITDFGLVTEGLRERQLLMELAPDLVRPVEMLFPILKGAGMPRWMVKVGLTLYDRLAGRYRLNPHRYLPWDEAAARAPLLNLDICRAVYSFWDGQTDDLALVQRVAASARALGAGISEGCRAVRITPTGEGWSVDLVDHQGHTRTVSARYVVNCLGPWANTLLESSGIPPAYRGINNKGVHLLLRNVDLDVGLFLQSLKGDGRIFFVLPWEGFTLVGTTEDLYGGDPDQVHTLPSEVTYLLENCNAFLRRPLMAADVVATFAGLRWLAAEEGLGLSETSRSHLVGERASGNGLLLTLYGGKLTTYRALAASLGDQLAEHFGETVPSRTHERATWVTQADCQPAPTVPSRFQGDVAPT